jgi:hypothetical protein
MAKLFTKVQAESCKPKEVAYNTLVSIYPSDGTPVSLDCESALRYSLMFNGNERRVELTGEAYFEVAPSFIRSGRKRLFYVTVNDVTVEVLGTHYNVNNYEEPERSIKRLELSGVEDSKLRHLNDLYSIKKCTQYLKCNYDKFVIRL